MEDHANPSRAASSRPPCLGELIGESPPMRKLRAIIEKVSKHLYAVLILGESGTGKELVARAIHDLGPRRDRPFAPVDCAALSPTLIESELFGHIRGAFTGATLSKRGLLEAGNHGTLFLDEIGNIPMDLQAKLLRAIQEKEVRPVGSTERIPVDIRVIAATNRDLESAVRRGAFREDLYFRLNVVQIKLAPLRERKTDIPLLVSHCLEKMPGPEEVVRTVSEEFIQRLMDYDWPGNVRELENAIERAVALSSDTALHEQDLPPNILRAVSNRLPADNELMPLNEMERRAIFLALRKTSGDKLAAARLLGIGKTTLYRKLKHYERDFLPSERPAESKESPPMEPFLICMNARCFHLFACQEGSGEGPAAMYRRRRRCPKCGHPMSGLCPFCSRMLKVKRVEDIPYCSQCLRALRAEPD